jgi:hypothetical protein
MAESAPSFSRALEIAVVKIWADPQTGSALASPDLKKNFLNVK